MERESIYISFKNSKLLPQLFGENDRNLNKLEKKLAVAVSARGNIVSIHGNSRNISISESILRNLYDKLEKGKDVSDSEVDAVIRMYTESSSESSVSPASPDQEQKTIRKINSVVLKTLKKHITPYSLKQADYMKSLLENELNFATGPAGTGKTYLAVAAAVALFIEGKVERIILSRPAVEAGEKLGFLPGDMKEKVDPYLRPLYDALYDMLPAEQVVKHIQNGEIEIAPLAFMRGRTLRHSFVILDEAQNTTKAQMKMFLTRLGEGTRMVITGDLTQTDLPKGIKSGLRDALEKLQEIDEVKVIHFTDEDSVRHPLTVKIIQAYAKHETDDGWKK